MRIKTYIPSNPNQVERSTLQMFLEAFKVLGGTMEPPVRFEQTENVGNAEIVFMSNMNDLGIIQQHPEHFFVIILLSSESNQTTESLPKADNVFLVEPAKLAPPPPLRPPPGPPKENGFVRFVKKLEAWQHRPGAPVREEVAVEFEDIQPCNKAYDVLVICGSEEDERIAKIVLKQHRLTTVRGLYEAKNVIGKQHFDIVLANARLPVDRTYPVLSVAYDTPEEIVPYGFAVVFEFTKLGLPVGLLTNADRRHDWVAAMFDYVRDPRTIEGQKVQFFSDLGGMRWDMALWVMMEKS